MFSLVAHFSGFTAPSNVQANLVRAASAPFAARIEMFSAS
jgi:hypothetical protein